MMFGEYTIVGVGNQEDLRKIWMLQHLNICEVVDPVPDELKGLHGFGDEVWRWRNISTGEVWSEEHSPTNFRPDEWEADFISERQAKRLLSKYGTLCARAWKAINWGTSTGAWNTDVNFRCGMTIVEFRSLYSFLNATVMRKIVDYMEAEFGFCGAKWVGHNPCRGETSAIYVAPKQTVSPKPKRRRPKLTVVTN